jgi:hypothetical protein
MSPTARDGRALADGSPAAVELFNQMVSGVEDFRTAEWPERFPRDQRRPVTRRR